MRSVHLPPSRGAPPSSTLPRKGRGAGEGGTWWFWVAVASCVVMAGCGPGAQPAATPTAGPASPPRAATPTVAAPRPAATPTAAAPPAAAPAELRGQFVDALSTLEDLQRIESDLGRLPGVRSVSGSEASVTVAYDPGQITPERVRQALADMGHPIR